MKKKLSSLRQGAVQAHTRDLEFLYNEVNVGVCICEMSDHKASTPTLYRILDMNPAYEHQFGLRREETVSISIQDFDEIDNPIDSAVCSKVVKNQVTETYERHYASSGRHFRISMVPLENRRFAAVVFDITDLKQADEDRRRSDAKYQDLFDRYPVGLVVSTLAEGRLVDCNEYIADMLGYSSKEECLKEYRLERHFVDPTSRERMARVLREQGYVKDLEIPLRDRNGKRLWVSYSARIEGDLIEGAGVNITARKEAECALQESETRYRRLARASHEAVAITKDGVLVEVTPQIQEIYGYTSDEFREHDLMSLVFPEDYDLVMEKIKSNAKGPYRHRGIHKDGRILYLEIRADSIMINGEHHRLTVIRDITELITMQEKLVTSEKMQAIGRLAGGVAHDFNNQLAGITGYADMLRESVGRDTELAEYVEGILLSTKRGADLTEQLLAFARKGKYLNEIVNIHELLAEVVGLLQRTIDRRITIRLDFRAGPTTVLGDPTQLQNAILNIALNARDAMPEGGRLTFSTAIASQLPESIVPQSREPALGKFVEIGISDTGHGMDPKTVKTIFEPFFTTKAPGKGTGMGLASVYGTVENHGGWVDVRSSPGKGTTMRLFIPQATSEKRNVALNEPVGSSVTGDAHVMVVDDESLLVEMVKSMLVSSGFRVTGFTGTSQAIEFYENNWFSVDLVILDMVMPCMNGRDVFLKMKSINPEVRALLSSGYSVSEVTEQSLQDGVAGFIKKPYRKAELTNAVTSLLS